MTRHAIALAGLLLASAAAQGSTLDVLNEARTRGCGVTPPPPALARSAALDRAAKALSDDATFDAALATAGVRPRSRAYVRLDGVRSDRDLRKRFDAEACQHVANRDYDEVGFASRGREMWIVLAKRYSPPTAADAPRIGAEMLAEVNRARAVARRCGGTSLPAVASLEGEARLDAAAQAYAREVVASGRFDHVGADGSSAPDRVAQVGYRYRVVGENLAAGPTTVAETVQGWLDSPPHCENLMDARYTQMGIGYAVDPASPQGIYWVQLLAAPAR